MFKILVLNKKRLALATFAIVLAATAIILFARSGPAQSASSSTDVDRIIHMVTGEFSTTLADGRKIESYRWDPGTVFVRKGENVQLSIYGVNGNHHPFEIEGLGIRGEVRKGEETIVRFTAEESGVYRLICLSHHDAHNEGPMIAYIVVQ